MTRTRRLSALPMVVALTVIGHAASAQAAPPPGSDPAPSCSFKLTTPTVVNVSGVDMVSAIMSPGECTGHFQPNSFTVCVAMLGDSGTPQCKFTPVYDAVQVFFSPYRSGAAYASTARECGNVFPTAEQSCTSLGPYTTTL